MDSNKDRNISEEDLKPQMLEIESFDELLIKHNASLNFIKDESYLQIVWFVSK